ncbi:hypothetical protein PIB30_043079 [Stylosanthes scabra]|uniref:NAC domain-containing protein n=1 Tax=Stylosanthes scabra TaxID=79078 RepID=A0ABU6SG60_9FABA|nr:hypothetical protein [Stylosanthes scabra]
MSRILGPGFRFHPTDDELVQFYLRRKIIGKLSHHDHIAVVNIYNYEPWQLPELSKLNTRDLEWYFFTVLDKKYEKGEKTKRATVNGYWKTTGKDREIKYGDRHVGMKKTLVYHEGRAPTGKRSNWVMHEYRMVDQKLAEAGYQLDAYVLCRIFEKSGMGPKNGEKYGAPFREEEWLDDGDLLEPKADEPVVELSVDQSDAFLETDDLDKNLGAHVVDGSADLPSNPPNFFYGECSHYPQHKQEFVEVPKPLEDPYTVEENHLGADPNTAEGNPPGPDPDTAEGNSPGTDLFAVDMVDQYLALSDDDILKYISFDDSPPSMEGENPSPEHIPPLIQQNVEEQVEDVLEKQQKVEGEAAYIFKTNKHDLEANSSRGGAASEDANPIAKRFKKWLDDIPAPPAFAAELPSKKDALRLHSAPQSSNTTHLTAGMVSITNITGRGNVRNPMVAKFGGFNHIITSAVVLVPVSGLLYGKTLFVLMHGWASLMTFSFLFVTVTCKIGTFMYSGK